MITNVRNCYINFSLCGDNFPNFIAHQWLQDFEDVTPPSLLDVWSSILYNIVIIYLMPKLRLQTSFHEITQDQACLNRNFEWAG
jgi:hypothetical protein